MSDYVRELLRMANGGHASARGPMHVPDEIMDNMAGDAAQESIMKSKLLTEMRRQDNAARDLSYVGLDLMEMEANHVDDFLDKARRHIIKRNKHRRAGCCEKLGGVLAQVFGPAGGEFAKPIPPEDRGMADPIGGADLDEGVYSAPGASSGRIIRKLMKPSERRVQDPGQNVGAGVPLPKIPGRDPREREQARAQRGAAATGSAPAAKTYRPETPEKKPGALARMGQSLANLGRGVRRVFGGNVEDIDSDTLLALVALEALQEGLSDEHKKVYAFRKGESRAARKARIAKYKKTGRLDEARNPKPDRAERAAMAAEVRRELGRRRRGPKDEATAEAFWKLIAEEFDLSEHDADCAFRAAVFAQLSEEEKFIQKAIKKPGALRAYFGVKEGEEIPVAKAKAKYAELQAKAEGDKTLSASDAKLFQRLQLFLKVLRKVKHEDISDNYSEGYVDYDDMQVSGTAKALAGFAESLGYGNNYKRRGYERVGHQAPPPGLDVADHPKDEPHKDAPYNDAYNTIPVKAKSGTGGTAGEPQHVGTRKVDVGDPIGEDTRPSNTAMALASFMESSHKANNWPLHNETHAEEGLATRKDSRETLGGAPVRAAQVKGDPSTGAEKKARYEKDADPRGGATSQQLTGVKQPSAPRLRGY